MMIYNMFTMFEPTNTLNSFNSVNMYLIIMALMMILMSPTDNFLNVWNTGSSPTKSYKNKYSYTVNMVFMYYVLTNTIGLVMFNYCNSAQFIFNVIIMYNLWLSLMMFAMKNKFNLVLANFTPSNIPNSFVFFLSTLEMVSLMIQPLALSLRMTANMMAGHILLYLCFNMLNSAPLVALLIPLLLLELLVAFVQAFVFKMLLDLYNLSL